MPRPSSTQPEYVGDAVCARCHADIARAYAQTWKARSFGRITASLPLIEDFTQPPVYDSHTNLHYQPRWEDSALYLYEYRLKGTDTLYRRRERLDYFIGSGHQTRSYLIWRNGFLYEAPITWYARLRKWDLSPGYEGGRNTRFSREIQPTCLECHASGWQAVPWTYNRYDTLGGAIGCESCHGPGSQHVRSPHDPAYHWRKWPLSRQIDVCSACHLEGLSLTKKNGWRPGLALADYRLVFLPIRPEWGPQGIASHAERLFLSACYQKGKVTCTTCHDPHPTSPPPPYEKRCQSCHSQKCPHSHHPTKSCISCHMPTGPTSDIPHTHFTDHYIRIVRPDSAFAPASAVPVLRCATEALADSSWLGEAYLRWYSQQSNHPAALSRALELLQRHPRAQALAEALLLAGRPAQALPWAQKALQEDTTLFRLELYAYLLEMTGQPEKALKVWEILRQKAPAYPEADFRAILLAYQLGRLSPAQTYAALERLTHIQPWNAQFQYNAAILAIQVGKYVQAKAHLETALAYEPDYPQALEAYQRLRQP
ncbi:MAG: multiheme c-type cytochrome [Bacteroidia bacterium]